MFESPNFEIAYFLSLGGVIFTCYVTANISGFFIIVTGYIEAQMFALSEELENIWRDAKEHYHSYKSTANNVQGVNRTNNFEEKEFLNEYVKNRLHEIINMHTKNIGFLQQIEHVFRSSIAIEFGLLIVSLIAEFLGGLENTYLQMPFASIQVIMDCITGQILMDASMAFEKAVYSCQWENFSVPNMKMVMMMLVNCQKVMSLTVGGLNSLSFLCLMTVVRMIYSTYTALRSTMNH